MIEINNNSFYLTDALYYDPEVVQKGGLRKGLREYRVFLLALAEAVSCLESGELEKFDALVGENACQIRAVRIAIIATQKLVDCSDLANRVSTALDSINALLESKEIDQLVRGKTSMATILKDYHLHISLSEEGMFIFLSYILSEMKIHERNNDTVFVSLTNRDKAAPKKIQRLDSEVSVKFMNRTASKLRNLLANESVHYVRNVATQLEDVSLTKMVSNEFTQAHNTWPCLPMFWTYKILIQITQRISIPILLSSECVIRENAQYSVVGHEKFLFELSHQNGEYVYVSDYDQTHHFHPVLVIQGTSCLDSWQTKSEWRQKILRYPIVDIILAGAADHRQYPDPNTVVFPNDEDYSKYQSLAQEGFSLENPKGFFINHVYVSTLK